MASTTPSTTVPAPKRRRIEAATRSGFRPPSVAPTSTKAPPPSTSYPPSACPVYATLAGAPGRPVVDPKAAQAQVQAQQGKYLAIQQAQREGCLGKYQTFDSPFGNYLVPVIPTRADLFGLQ